MFPNGRTKGWRAVSALTVGLLANLVAWQVIFGTNVLLSIPLGPRMILAGLLVVASGGFAARALIAVRKYRAPRQQREP